MKIKISKKKPLIFWILKWKYSVKWGTLVIAWGNTIYSGENFSDDLYVHEITHLTRQRYSKLRGLIWWWKYLKNPQFRMNEELEAYRNQWKFIKKTVQDRNKRSVLLEHIVASFSGKMYGNIITPYHARRMIQQ